MSEISVSVVIPTFNRRHTIERALDSVIGQSFAAQEIILVDDGSTDQTALVMQQSYPDLTVVTQANKGVSAARNAGITLAGSEWIALLDSDDEWLPNKLQTQVEALTASPDLKVCHTEEIWIRNGKRVNQMKKHQKHGGWIFDKCLPLCAMSPSTIVIHKSVFDEVGLFDETLPACEDYDMWLRISSRYPVLLLEQPLIKKYGGHKDQLSQQYWGMDRFRVRALENILQSKCLSEDLRKRATDMLEQKLKIMTTGASKRGNQSLSADYANKLSKLIGNRA